MDNDIINFLTGKRVEQPYRIHVRGGMSSVTERQLMELVENKELKPKHLRIAKNGELLSPNLYIHEADLSCEKIDRLFNVEKATLIFENLENYFPVFSDLMSEARFFIPDMKFQISAYLTPAGSQGFDAHWDLMEVLMLQISGEKKWQVWDPIYKKPFFSADEVAMKETLKSYCSVSKKCMDEILVPQTALFLPRGYIHAGETLSTSSLHVTIGFRRPTILDHLISKVEFRNCLGQVLAQNKNSNLYVDDLHFNEFKASMISQLEQRLA